MFLSHYDVNCVSEQTTGNVIYLFYVIKKLFFEKKRFAVLQKGFYALFDLINSAHAIGC